MNIQDMKKIVDEINYLEGELEQKPLYGYQRDDGRVSIDHLVEWLEHDDCDNIHMMEHLISVVKLKNGKA